MPIGINQAAFAEFIAGLPFGLAGLEVLASPAFAVRVAVGKVADFDDAAVVVNHDFVGIDLTRGETAPARRDFEEVAAGAITGGDVDQVVVINRGRDNRYLPPAWRAPEQLAIGSRETGDAAGSELN